MTAPSWKKTIPERVLEIIREQMGVETATLADRLSDLGADSLDVVQIVMDCESKFSVDIPQDDADRFKCGQDIADYLARVI